MVQCDACSKWYHTICIGICVNHFDDQTRFWCCQAQAQDEQFEVVSCMRGKRRSVLKLSDIRTIWPEAGISDAVIDFFVRILLPKCAVDMVASALSYTAVIDALDQGPEELKRKFMNTNGLLDLSHEPLLFPCCIESVWHWILIAVYKEQQIAFVLDLVSPCTLTFTSRGAVAALTTLLQCWYPSLSLKALAYKVPLQTSGVDCGVHVVHHIQSIVKLSSDSNTLITNPGMLNFPVNAASLRKMILFECYSHSKVSARKRKKRVVESQVQAGEMASLREMILKQDTSNLKIVEIHGKGKGVIVAKTQINQGEFVCEYIGGP